MKKRMLIIFLIILIFVFLFQKTKLVEIMGLFPPEENDLEKTYYANETELLYICEYLLDNKYMDIRIDIFDSTKNIICYEDNGKGVYNKHTYKITDQNLINSLETIKKRGFIRILKEYNYLYFQTWGSFGGDIGLIFSPNEEPNISEINAKDKVVKKIKPVGWYYYRETFE